MSDTDRQPSDWTAEEFAAVFEEPHPEDVEPKDDWPMCAACQVRFPTPDLLAAHLNREPDHLALIPREDTP